MAILCSRVQCHHAHLVANSWVRTPLEQACNACGRPVTCGETECSVTVAVPLIGAACPTERKEGHYHLVKAPLRCHHQRSRASFTFGSCGRGSLCSQQQLAYRLETTMTAREHQARKHLNSRIKVCHDRILRGAAECKLISKRVHLALGQHALFNDFFDQCIDTCPPHLIIPLSCVRHIFV